MQGQIQFNIEDFKAVKKAEILLDGITVVAGVNASGKSTISKLIYDSYQISAHFDEILERRLTSRLRKVTRFLDIIMSEINSVSTNRNSLEEMHSMRDITKRFKHLKEEDLKSWLDFIDNVENNYLSQPKFQNSFNQEIKKNRHDRLEFMIRDINNEKGILKINEDKPFSAVADYVKKIYEEAMQNLRDRPMSIFRSELTNIYSHEVPHKFEVSEIGNVITSFSQTRFGLSYLIEESIYIDSPSIFNNRFYLPPVNRYLEKVRDLLSNKSPISTFIDTGLISKVIGGDIDSESQLVDFTYKRDDGSNFDLIDCATGIKSFAILQILLKNGHINDRTLVVIDEPELNLHPQWIVEYARVIVLLNKLIGVRFFIASHNPDMVSAIKHIYEKENTAKGLNFYIAKKENKDAYQYIYEKCGTDIEPIFQSFNIAFDRINFYSGDE